MKRFLSIGECMIEMAPVEGGLYRKGFAGDTLNTAWYARAFLPDTWAVDYFTALGNDPQSQEMAAFLGKAAIGTALIKHIEGKSPGLYMISLVNGERSFSYWRDTSAARLLATDRDHLRAAIDASDVVYFSGITLAILSEADARTFLEEARRARDSGKIVAFDPNIRPRLWRNASAMRATISAGAEVSSIVLPSFDDEAATFGDASIEACIARYRSLGARHVLVKDGAKGAHFDFDGTKGFVPAHKVDTVVDTTGAGDSFNGSFFAAYLQSGEAASAASFAAAVAAAVVTERGALVDHALLKSKAEIMPI